jgi:hypothetical protein
MKKTLGENTDLKLLVQEWSSRLRVKPRIVRVQSMSRKWGSCSTGGVVTLASDLSQKPKRFQEYVVAHELLHLRLKNHGKLFQATLSAHFPGWKKEDLER